MNRILASLTAFCLLGVLSAPIARAEDPYNVEWTRQFDIFASYDFEYGLGLAVDAAGRAYISGFIQNGGYSGDSSTAFLTKRDAAGNAIWSESIGSGSAADVAVDAAGNAYVSGSRRFGQPVGYDAYLKKFNDAGNLIWSREIGTPSFDSGHGVSLDIAGNVYLSGSTGGNLYGPSAGSIDTVLAKYDGAGNVIWSRQFGTSSSDWGSGVAIDAAGNAYISGYTHGDLAGPNAGNSDAFITKYDGSGNLAWSRQFGTTSDDFAYDVAVDIAGNAYMTGRTQGSLGGPSAGGSDSFLTKYDAAGNLLWSRQFGTSDDEAGFAVEVDAAGNVYMGTGDLRPGDLPAGYRYPGQAFLTKYDPAGGLLWSQQIVGTGYDHIRGLAIGPANSVMVSGFSSDNNAPPSEKDFDALLIKFTIPGDLDDDGDVDSHDIDTLWNVIRPEIAGDDDPGEDDNEDLNDDGFVNEDDVDYMLANLLTAGPSRPYGDADLDGGVGGLDYTAWRQRAGTGWANGDFDGDGGVGGLDYALWRTRPTAYPNTVSSHSGIPSAVPEPSTFALAALGIFGLAVLARRAT